MKISKKQIESLTLNINGREEQLNNFRNDNDKFAKPDFIYYSYKVNSDIADIKDRLFTDTTFEKTGLFEIELTNNEVNELFKDRKIVFTEVIEKGVDVDVLLKDIKLVRENIINMSKEDIIKQIEDNIYESRTIEHKIV